PIPEWLKDNSETFYSRNIIRKAATHFKLYNNKSVIDLRPYKIAEYEFSHKSSAISHLSIQNSNKQVSIAETVLDSVSCFGVDSYLIQTQQSSEKNVSQSTPKIDIKESEDDVLQEILKTNQKLEMLLAIHSTKKNDKN
ncbi:MAG: hypothetical protein MHPSP_002025, partial [Paramarteilia canceri]